MCDEYVRMFWEEAEELLATLGPSLRRLEEALDEGGGYDEELLDSILRILHTLKGSAGMVNLIEVARAAHEAEAVFKRCREQGRVPSREELEPVHAFLDLLSDGVRPDREGEEELDPAPGDEEKPEAMQVSLPSEDGIQRRSRTRYPFQDTESIRVDLAKLDRLVNLLGEFLICHSALEDTARRLLWDAGGRRGMEAGGGCGATAVENAARTLLDWLQRLRYLYDDIYYQTLDVRTVPFESIAEEFYQSVRRLGRELGKEAALEMVGGETRMDKRLLDTLRPVLLHMIRNSLDHGIEPPAERVRAGKPPRGLIRIRVEHLGEQIQIMVEDDGRGIDPELVRAKALERGLMDRAELEHLSDEEAMALIFMPGFSTARIITEISGRGIGMDVVKKSIESMRGTIGIRSRKGEGTVISFRLPVSLATRKVLQVKCGGFEYALPLEEVERVASIPARRLEVRSAGVFCKLEGRLSRVVPLSDVLGTGGPFDLEVRRREGRSVRLHGVMLCFRDRRLFVLVDEVVGEDEIVVRPLSGILEGAPFVSGVSFLPSGVPMIVLDNAAVVEEGLRMGGRVFSADSASSERERGGRPGLQVASSAAPGRLRGLVVDDSITSRIVEKNILEEGGYEVDLAVSGEEALRKVMERDYDFFVVDVDMPGMDGITFTSRLRSMQGGEVPVVVMISSHKEPSVVRRALEAGADEFVNKYDLTYGVLLDTLERRLAAVEGGRRRRQGAGCTQEDEAR